MPLRLLPFCLASALLLGPAATSSSGHGAPSEPEPERAAAAAVEIPPSDAAATSDDGRSVVADQILPSGLRVIASRDDSLPVAAVVLAIEVGTRDDPDDLPGLVHGLAYHLQMGNRQLHPGEALAAAHDVGGLASMAVGFAQVRYETLIPVSQLDEILRIEAKRLRAPTLGKTLWLKSLGYARADRGRRPRIPAAIQADAWQDPGMAHDGRTVAPELGALEPEPMGLHLAGLFSYERATLVVVSPRDPAKVVEQIESLLADLPSRARNAKDRTPPGPAGTQPRVRVTEKQRDEYMVWPVPARHDARAWAQVLCGTLNRQKTADPEPKGINVRCTYVPNPRRPTLAVRVRGGGAAEVLTDRLARISDGREGKLLEAQRDRMAREIRHTLRTPLQRAGYLARTGSRSATAGVDRVPEARALGLDALDDGRPPEAALAAAVPSLLMLGSALHWVGPNRVVDPPPEDVAEPPVKEEAQP